MGIMKEAIRNGMKKKRVYTVVGISERRFREWNQRAASGDVDRHKKSDDVRPYNALTPEEHRIIKESVEYSEWADLSCRELSVKIMERHMVYISHVAIWEFEQQHGLAGHRGKRRLMGRHRGIAPDTSFVKGPNQLCAYDFTKLPTGVAHRFWHLCAVIDQYSRKVTGWDIDEKADAELVKRTWDKALLSEGLTEENAPASLSDRGSQMRAISTREFFQGLGVSQLFARARTPNDNPYIESLYATVKTHPNYPVIFSTKEDAIKYFTWFFNWYNNEHLHTRIGMVTPSQKHSGEWKNILAQREKIKALTFARRRAYNSNLRGLNKDPKTAVS